MMTQWLPDSPSPLPRCGMVWPYGLDGSLMQPCKHKRVVAPWHDVEVRLYPGWCGRHCCEQQGPELQLHTAF